jgi:hypothetical protein
VNSPNSFAIAVIYSLLCTFVNSLRFLKRLRLFKHSHTTFNTLSTCIRSLHKRHRFLETLSQVTLHSLCLTDAESSRKCKDIKPHKSHSDSFLYNFGYMLSLFSHTNAAILPSNKTTVYFRTFQIHHSQLIIRFSTTREIGNTTLNKLQIRFFLIL